MDIFSGKLPILKICATLPRAEVTGCSADIEALAHFLTQSGCLNEKQKQTFLTLGKALHNGNLLNLWQKFLSRSMPVEKQEQAVQYAESILRFNNPDLSRFKDPEFVPTIEQFCGIDLACTSLVYAERQLNTMLALSSQSKLNPVFNPYIVGSKNPLLETDDNQIKLNQMLLNQKIENTPDIQKTINYWWQNTLAGKKYELSYGALQDDLVKILIANRHRVLGSVALHDHRVIARHPDRRARPTGNNWRGREE